MSRPTWWSTRRSRRCADRCSWWPASQGVGWDEFATIRLAGQQRRHGLVLEVDRDLAVVQVLEGTDGPGPGRDHGGVRRRTTGNSRRHGLARAGVQRSRGTPRRRAAGARTPARRGRRPAAQPDSARAASRTRADRCIYCGWSDDAGARTEAARVLGRRSAPPRPGDADRGPGHRRRRGLLRGVAAHGAHARRRRRHARRAGRPRRGGGTGAPAQHRRRPGRGAHPHPPPGADHRRGPRVRTRSPRPRRRRGHDQLLRGAA